MVINIFLKFSINFCYSKNENLQISLEIFMCSILKKLYEIECKLTHDINYIVEFSLSENLLPLSMLIMKFKANLLLQKFRKEY